MEEKRKPVRICGQLKELLEGQEHIKHELDRIFEILKHIEVKEKQLSKELDTLTAQVAANTDVEKSAVVLIQGIAAQLEAAKNDPVKIQALADSLKASDDE